MPFRIIQGSAQNITPQAAGGSSQQSNAFGSQTRAIRVCLAAAYTGATAAGTGVRIEIGDNPVASATTTLFAANAPEEFIVSPGQKLAVISNDTVLTPINVVELTQ